jgi:hypothetical protein
MWRAAAEIRNAISALWKRMWEIRPNRRFAVQIPAAMRQ